VTPFPSERLRLGSASFDATWQKARLEREKSKKWGNFPNVRPLVTIL